MPFEYTTELIENINRWHMEIDDSGFVHLSQDNWYSEDVCSPYSRLYLVSGGEGWIEIEKERFPLRPGYAYFIPAGLTFSYGCVDTLEKLYFHLRLVKPDGYDLRSVLLRKVCSKACSGGIVGTAGKTYWSWSRRSVL